MVSHMGRWSQPYLYHISKIILPNTQSSLINFLDFIKQPVKKNVILPIWDLTQHSFVPQQANMQMNMADVKPTMNSAITKNNKIPFNFFINLWE